MAKVALIERELKRDRLVAKYAAKHAELKAISQDMKRSDEERAAARLGLQKLPATQTPHVNVTAVPSLAAHVVRSVNLASAAPKFVN